jgi:hypothetical protein
MLLTPPREQARERAAPRAEASAREGRGDAWLLLGDLDAALFQAGFVDVVIERLPRPRTIFAGGFGALNGVLALDARALAFRIGWERARASHLLGAAALERSPLLRLRRNGRSPLAQSLLGPVDGAHVRTGDATSLHVLTAAGFADFEVGSPAVTTTLVSQSLRRRPDAAALAAAIDASVALGVDRIIAFGVDERFIGARDVGRAVEDARSARIEVLVLAMSVAERPGMLGYLLPGLGRADRLIEAGRASARRWLSESGRSPAAP